MWIFASVHLYTIYIYIPFHLKHLNYLAIPQNIFTDGFTGKASLNTSLAAYKYPKFCYIYIVSISCCPVQLVNEVLISTRNFTIQAEVPPMSSPQWQQVHSPHQRGVHKWCLLSLLYNTNELSSVVVVFVMVAKATRWGTMRSTVFVIIPLNKKISYLLYITQNNVGTVI